MFETLVGTSCFTAAEQQKLLQRINEQSTTKVTQLSGQWLYYLHLDGDKDLARAKQLLELDGNDHLIPSHSKNTAEAFVYPRNISPWSSKATSIAQVCGLDGVVRVERGRVVHLQFEKDAPSEQDVAAFRDLIHDRMTEFFAAQPPRLETMFAEGVRGPLVVVDIFTDARGPLHALQDYNKEMGLGLDEPNMQYLVEEYKKLGRSPNDVELFMFAQVNSEHCRHHVFNANWVIDGVAKDNSLFGMIKNTHKTTPDFVVSAYSDNAAVMSGVEGQYWAPDYSSRSWKLTKEVVQPLIKVETHNHPTAISPFPGAATGSGGEIRDEGAVGRGSSPKAGLCGFWVSDLLIPGRQKPWELDIGRPAHYASSLDIMLEAPIGSARFNNEFGRPALTGTFRTLLANVSESKDAPEYRGYHKPIMIAGGIGSVRPQHAIKDGSLVHEGAHVIVLGGPAMLIGLGGGAASSNTGSDATADLDFDSVQRGNPEMERRAQVVIDSCVSFGEENPIAFIHDVGAGGLSNALPELVKDAGFGGKFELRQIDSADNSMSPLAIFCNEAQERYVLLVNSDSMERFTAICKRERCPFSDVGTVAGHDKAGAASLVLTDSEPTVQPPVDPINVPMDLLFPPGRRITKDVKTVSKDLQRFAAAECLEKQHGVSSTKDLITKATELVFHLPSVGSKMFLITIADRTVRGLTVRDQLVGPWQTPVADVAVTLTSFDLEDSKSRSGEAMAMGEKPTLALISAGASARMAVAESLMNLAATDIKPGSESGDLKRVKLSANWMAAVNHSGEGADLYEAVQAIGMELCPALGVSIPVGKDSTSMKASWKDRESGESKAVTAPVSLVISAFSLVDDVRQTWTPQLRRVEEVGETVLLFVDLAQGRKALGGSALAQVLGHIGQEAPDVRDVGLFKSFFKVASQLHQDDIVLAYHDRSDGGLLTTVVEMMFAGRCGVDLSLDNIIHSESEILDVLFNEELGAVFQVRKSDEVKFREAFSAAGLSNVVQSIGHVRPATIQTLHVVLQSQTVVELGRSQLQQWWSNTSYEMQKLRDNPASAQAEYAGLLDDLDPGLTFNLKFNPGDISLPVLTMLKDVVTRPKVAILREQGVNGYAEMAFGFRAAGFDAVDVHMSDILGGMSLNDFRGLAACGGFSYGDVLGAGNGWAQSILMHDGARKTFQDFFNRTNTFSLGVCNGCQMLTRLKELIPGAEHWPTFVENASQQFEARYSMVTIADSSPTSVFFSDMSGSSLPIVVSHGEGRAEFSSSADLQALGDEGLIPLRYVDNYGAVTEKYPLNPNGSPAGVAGVRSKDGRVVAMMPHPERTIMADVGSWAPSAQREAWGQYSPWFRLFLNARKWVG